jgi:hypothetical protein
VVDVKLLGPGVPGPPIGEIRHFHDEVEQLTGEVEFGPIIGPCQADPDDTGESSGDFFRRVMGAG